jgi:hypothetical protein
VLHILPNFMKEQQIYLPDYIHHHPCTRTRLRGRRTHSDRSQSLVGRGTPGPGRPLASKRPLGSRSVWALRSLGSAARLPASKTMTKELP